MTNWMNTRDTGSNNTRGRVPIAALPSNDRATATRSAVCADAAFVLPAAPPDDAVRASMLALAADAAAFCRDAVEDP